jgi:hypothetical protein
LYLGPDLNGEFKPVVVKAIHCKRISVSQVFKGQYCTLEVDIKENEVRKGMVLIDEFSKKLSVKLFEATLWNLGGKDIRLSENKSHFVISSGQIRQEAEFKTCSMEKLKDSESDTIEINQEEPVKESDTTKGKKSEGMTIIKQKTEGMTIIKPNEYAEKVLIEFSYNSEFLREGSHLVILNSGIKCYGIVTKLVA